jgi:hypothetical protein
MSRENFEGLVASLCEAISLPDPQAVLERGWIEVEGFEVLLAHFENDPGAMYMNFHFDIVTAGRTLPNFHFGIVTAGRTLQVFRLMLQANLTVYAQDQAQVGINPDTSGIVLIVRVSMTYEVSGPWLAETLGHYAEHCRY